MRIALITDVHANRQAMQAVLDHVAGQAVDSHALLGDFVGYGGDPGWVIDTIRGLVARGAVAVQGNHDAAVARGSLPSMRADARLVVDWTREQLQPAQIDFLASLPLTQELGDMLFVHANAYEPAAWDYVQGRAEAVRSMHATRARVTFCGHMHDPRLYHLSGTGKAGEFVPTSGEPIPLLGSRRWLAIPGSTGQPRDGNPAACYAVYDDAKAELTFWRVPYDAEAAGERIREAGLPGVLADRLLDGR
jgi:diadenosine tetraphosphatase ApaH/serine/threonine PP2A family protein phosphatase